MPSLSESAGSWTRCKKSKSVVMLSVAKWRSTWTGDLYLQLYINTKHASKNGVNKSYARKYVPANTFSSLKKGPKGYWQFSSSKRNIY